MKIENPEDYQAALYIRLSKEDENEGPSQSVTNQQSLLKEFAAEQGLKIHAVYIDDGWSGTNFDRPSFKRLLGDIEAKRVNMVITKDLSRLGRDYILTGHYLERYFPEHEVRYISLLDGIDTGTDSTVNDITPFKAIMNDMYAKDISKKIKAVKHDKQKKGLFIGAKPVYGYKMHPSEKNKIVIDKEAAEIVKRIFAYASEGLSCRQIAVQLNEEQIPSPGMYCGRKNRGGIYSGLWSSERISAMLQNETYIGNMVQGRTVKASYKSKKCLRQAKEDWLVVENTHEAIIDKETFHKIQFLLNSRKYTRSRTYEYLLKGLIFCHECGYPLAVINRKNTQGEDILYFVCRTYQRFSKSGACSGHFIKEKTVNEAVIARVQEICWQYFAFEQLEPLAQKIIDKWQKDAASAAEIKALRQEIDSLNDKMDKIYLDQLNDFLSEADFKRILQKIEQKRQRAEERLTALEKRETARPEINVKDIIEDFRQNFFSERQFLVSLIERIELTEEKNIIIKFLFKQPEIILPV